MGGCLRKNVLAFYNGGNVLKAVLKNASTAISP